MEKNIVDYLRDQGTTDCVAYTEFMLNYKKGEDSLYCFFEGFEDRVYYTIRINNISTSSSHKSFVCGGKNEVLKVYKLIKQNIYYSSVRTGFFVDRDFDNNSNISSDIYITPTYSIENLYCFETTFRSILEAEFKMTVSAPDFAKATNNYTSLLNKFCDEISFFNAWLACQADARYQGQIKDRLNIDKKVKRIFEKIVLPDLSGIKNLQELQSKNSLESIYPEAINIDDETVSHKLSFFNNTDKRVLFRGKFLLYFLENYLKLLQSVFGTNDSPFEKKYSCSLRFEYVTICSTLSQYAYTPNCLKQYIKRL